MGEGCWEWQAGRSPRGYGKVCVANKHWRAHRLAWTLTYGEIPAGLVVMHRCDNPPCVRPDHLQLGTCADNNRDKVAKGRDSRGDAHYARREPWRLLRGEQHGRAKLTEEQVRFIREEFQPGYGAWKALALRLGVSVSLLHLVRKGTIWKDKPVVQVAG